MKNSNRIGAKSRSAFAWDLIGSFIKQGTTILITIVLARLLGPEEFGLIGIALVFITLSQVFVDVGFTDGLIQKQGVTRVVYSSIFFLNMAISIALALLIFVAAPAIGSFYERGELADVIRWLILVIPISAIGKVHETQLRKDLKFKSLTIRTIVSANLGGVAGIIAAYKGMGVYSLVVQQLTNAVTSSILLWISTNWKPQFAFSWSEVRSLFTFSGYVFLDNGIHQLFQRIDVLFIGKVFSPVTLGYYSRAESLNFQVTAYTGSTLRKVMFPVLSSVQHDEGKFNSIFLKVFALLAVLSGALAGLLYFLADDIILILLGDQWAPTIVLFQILVFRTVISPFGVLLGKSLLSKGYSKEKFFISLLSRLVMLAPMVVGFFTDITGFALAVVIASFFSFLLKVYMVDRMIRIKFWDQLVLFIRPLIPLFITLPLLSFSPVELNSLVKAAVFLLVYVVFLSVVKDPGYKLLLQEIAGMFSKVRARVLQRL